MARMTREVLRELCRKDKLYMTAELNDKLYLHYKGFTRIENLEPFTGLKVLWLEGNGLRRIEGLDAQAELVTLYLHENAIEVMENLSHLVRACVRCGDGRCCGQLRWLLREPTRSRSALPRRSRWTRSTSAKTSSPVSPAWPLSQPSR